MSIMDCNFDELTIDDALFVGVVYDLAQPIHLHGDDYETLLEKAPEAAYVVIVHHRVDMLVNRFRSLNIVKKLLSFESFPVETPSGTLSRENWVRITLDVLLTRITSIRDCAFLLVNEIFELGMDYRRVNRNSLLSHATISHLDPLCSIINGLAEVGQAL